MDHRRRAERDRARRPAHAEGPSVPAPGEQRLREPQHRDVRQARRPLVHRAERRSTAASIRRSARCGCSAHRAAKGPTGSRRHRRAHVYYASLAGRYLGRIDVRTGRATVLRPPTAGQGARRAWSDSRGRIWISEWNAGQGRHVRPAHEALARVARAGREPDGLRGLRRRARQGLADATSGRTRSWRFDPGTARFTSVALPSADAAVRQILGRPGEVWGAESGTDKLVVV